MSELKEKCGIVGIYAPGRPVSRLCFFGLFALQHRGQEASGITTNADDKLKTHIGAGLVGQVYKEEDIDNLSGYIGIGHNRYSTSGGSVFKHAQPVLNDDETFALAHNGNLPSVTALKDFLKSERALKEDRNDSELISDAVDVYLKKGMRLEGAVEKVFPLLTGAYALVMMTRDTLVALRDPFGMRPLCMGSLGSSGEGFVVASETCALKTIEAGFIQEILPGEMVVINQEGLKCHTLAPATPKHDIFEYVYFARPDSVMNGKLIYSVRKDFGKALAREFIKKHGKKFEIDAVVPVPDTSMPVAIGFSEASGIPLELALVKNRYVHRTFLEPDQESRRASVALKLIPQPEVLAGKRIAVIDDSIVRGHTSRKLVQRLYENGAKEVHLVISSPPIRYPDFYGIDTPKQTELIAAGKTVEEMREWLGVTSLMFLSLEGLVEGVGIPKENLCTSFFTGEYPIDLKERKSEVSYDVPKD
ncbi:MAG: amidophosphoribosyltransferase [Patescibacteria group bacterium]